jgi:hypothetical protein
VHLTELSWPRELAVLMTELAGLFAGLDERLDVLGIPEGGRSWSARAASTTWR